jgi:hypothetical protein
VFARRTVSMEFTGGPTYTVVQQGGPARKVEVDGVVGLGDASTDAGGGGR